MKAQYCFEIDDVVKGLFDRFKKGNGRTSNGKQGLFEGRSVGKYFFIPRWKWRSSTLHLQVLHRPLLRSSRLLLRKSIGR